MERRPQLRVSDRERQAAADRLGGALREGRLDLAEYDDRLAKAYAAVTYADLDRLFADLPAPSRPERVPVQARAVPALPSLTAAQPGALKVLWTIWLTCVVVNLTVWLLVSLLGGVVYFWPVWFAVPGAALLAVTLGGASMRGERPADAHRAARADAHAQRRYAHEQRRYAHEQRRLVHAQRQAARRRRSC